LSQFGNTFRRPAAYRPLDRCPHRRHRRSGGPSGPRQVS